MSLLPDNERLQLYRRSDVRQLLSWTVQGHEEIRPLPGKEGDHFPEVSRILGSPERGISLLEELAAAGFYRRVKAEVEPVCPECGDTKIFSSYTCPFCESHDLEKGSRLEHYPCGHVDFQKNFYKDGQLVCPKCDIELRLLGTDYQRIDNLFHCNDCKRDSSVPKITWVCADYGHTFSHEEAKLKPVYGYTFNEELRKEVVAHCLIELPFVRFMESLGYQAEPLQALSGSSGAEHVFDVVAKGGDQTVVFALASSTNEIGRESVLNFFAKLFDVKADHAILVAMPGLSEDARRLAELYRIEYIEGELVEEILDKLPQLIPRAGRPITSRERNLKIEAPERTATNIASTREETEKEREAESTTRPEAGATNIKIDALQEAMRRFIIPTRKERREEEDKLIPATEKSREKTATALDVRPKPSSYSESAVEAESLKEIVETPIHTPERIKEEPESTSITEPTHTTRVSTVEIQPQRDTEVLDRLREKVKIEKTRLRDILSRIELKAEEETQPQNDASQQRHVLVQKTETKRRQEDQIALDLEKLERLERIGRLLRVIASVIEETNIPEEEPRITTEETPDVQESTLLEADISLARSSEEDQKRKMDFLHEEMKRILEFGKEQGSPRS